MNSPPPLDRVRHALFLDFDGTLAPLQDDPAAVFLAPDRSQMLVQLANSMTQSLAVISGRSLQDLSLRIPQVIFRIGGHGLEISSDDARNVAKPVHAPEDLHDAISRAAFEFDDVRIEPKGRVIAVHYRANPECAAELESALRSVVADYPEYSIMSGKMVIEAKPIDANKGKALERVMLQTPFAGRIPVMVGDDSTDEYAMASANQLGGFGIKVGSGQTCAAWRVADTDAVWTWLGGTP